MGNLSFLMAVHNHQPCDNFGWVFEEAYEKAYEPFINVLERFPDVRVAIHYSGSLLEWLYEHRPDFIERIRALIKKRQIELLSGGFYEPILPIIPDDDKAGQIDLLTSFIKNRFEYVPTGAWITERVWDDLSGVYKKAGIQYAVVDENHFKCAGVQDVPVNGYYKLNDGFNVFGADKKLRYMIPFAGVNDIFSYLGDVSKALGDTCLVFADDGEKFGLWPNTFGSVYKRGWLESFFSELSKEKNGIRSESFSDVLLKSRHKGTISIPPCSYSEMMEWSNGDFNNFFKKYPEANIMRKRMVDVSGLVNTACSEKLATSRQKEAFNSAKKELYKAQSGCAYWHGIFGGIYLNHLRAGVYKHLITAQKLVEEASVKSPIKVRELDMDDDQENEIVAGNKYLNLYIKPDKRGSIFGLDDKTTAKNMINVLSRKPELYHNKIMSGRKDKISLKTIRENVKDGVYFNIHDVLGVKDKRLKKFMIYDKGRKDCLIDYFITGKFSLKDYETLNSENLYEISRNAYSVKKEITEGSVSFIMYKEEAFPVNKHISSVSLEKTITLKDSPYFRVSYTMKNISDRKIDSMFATEFNWSVMNNDMMKRRNFTRIRTFEINDQWDNSRIKFDFTKETGIWTIPIYTINESESGLEKTYQYLRCLIKNPVILEPEEDAKFEFTVTIK